MTTSAPVANIYRHVYNSFGYVVYRHCFEGPADFDKVRVHLVATFRCETEASDYCRYRNRLMDERGSDAL